MIVGRSIILSTTLLVALAQSAISATVPASFTSASSEPLTVPAYNAVGHKIALNLNFAPQAGCNLTVIKVIGLDFIEGRFSNLAQGQKVGLTHAGQSYKFVANYYGGSGNDLVLHWADQQLVAWGSNQSGQFGNNSRINSSAPVGVEPPLFALEGRKIAAVSFGASHTLALCSDGTLATWGENSAGQLGNGTDLARETAVFVDRSGVLAGKTVVSIATGARHNLVLCSDGTLIAWGSNQEGQLGAGDLFWSSKVPILVDQSGVLAGKTVVKVAAAADYCMALCSDGTVATWGSGPLGRGSEGSKLPLLVDQTGVLAGKTVVGISAGGVMNLAVCSDGTVASWGDNSYGALGNGSSAVGLVSKLPVLVRNDGVLAGKQVVAASAARGMYCLAVCSDGFVAAWGYNSHGSLGNGTNVSSNVPVEVDRTGFLADKTVVSVAGNGFYSHAICSDGSLAEWGEDLKKTPVAASLGALEGRAVVSVSYAIDYNWALCSDGTLVKWGFANKLPTEADPKPPVLGGKTIVSLAAGASHSLALCADGTLAAWGWTNHGLLGNGSGYSTDTKIYQIDANGILAGKFVVAVAASQTHNLALCSDGTVAAWGENTCGALGDGTLTDRSVPVAVDQTGVLAGKKVVSIEAGANFSLVLCSDGTIYTWGRNSDGELGDGTTADRKVPVAVEHGGVLAGRSVVRISAKWSHSLALCSNGTLVSWGLGERGQLGNGTNLNMSVPVAVDQSGVLAGKSIISIKTQGAGCVVLCSDGTLASWGSNESGELGDDGAFDRNLPGLVDLTGVLAGRKVVDIAGGLTHCVAICADSTLAAWGDNGSGQMGTGNSVRIDFSYRPALVDRAGFLSGKKVTAVSAARYHSLAIAALSPLPLKNITTSASPIPFDQAVTSYALSVANETTSISVTTTYEAMATSVTVLNLPVASGEASAEVPLEVGTIPISIKVTHFNGSATTYVIQVTRRTEASDPTLTSLTVDQGTFAPVFSPQTLVYDVEVPDDVSFAQINAIPANGKATLLYGDPSIGFYTLNSKIPLSFGNNEIPIRVTPEDQSTFSTYTLNIHRRSPDLSGIRGSAGKVTPAFSTSIDKYEIKVSNKVASIRLTADSSNPEAALTLDRGYMTAGIPSREILLTAGVTTTAVVRVSDPAGLKTKDYRVRITRAASSDATLSGLSVTHAVLSPSFKPKKNDYSAKVANSVQSVRIKAVTADETAAVKVNGDAVESGTATQPVRLAVGKNTIQVKVKAQDGSFNTYKVTVTRSPAPKKNGSQPAVMAAAPVTDSPVISRYRSDGLTYLQVAAAKHPDGSAPLVEVSSNLIDWFSGNLHTEVIGEDQSRIVVRDRTSIVPGKKRFIRVW